MKSFKEFLAEAESKAYKIYCDMDGVLCDFIEGVKKTMHIKGEPNQYEIEEFLGTLEGSSVHWWENLGWQPGGKRLWKMLKELNTEILSACPNQCKMTPNVIKGKKRWCKKNLKMTTGVNVTTRKGKVKFAAPSHILIDDYIKNVNEWKAAGGIGIHHTDPRTTAKELRDAILDQLKGEFV